MPLLLQGSGHGEHQQRHEGGDISFEDDERTTPATHIMVVVVSPSTLPAPPALDAATMAAR